MLAGLKEKAQAAWDKRPGLLRGRNLMFAGGALAVLLLSYWFFGRGQEDENPYRTAAVDRGTITRVVSATGTLEPVIKANVGSTVSGPVQAVLVDFNSQVRTGQVLARLDPAPFQQRVVQAQASLAQQQAQLAAAEADYQRYVLLQQRGFASEQLMSQQRAARDGQRAAVQQASAQLATARTDLERSVIRSPIDGVVVDRQVNVGQPVAASLQASTLFVIAQDLSRLQANITVDEADIGDVREGMPVRFTVDAFPDREFDGSVSQVRQQGTSAQGVVSYTVVVQADNPGRQLLPGMTANAEIILEQRENVARLPNTALRFRPNDQELAARGQALLSGGGQQQQRQDGAFASTGAQGGGQGQERGAGAGGPGGGGARMVEQLTQQLELTPQQQQVAQQAAQDAFQAMRASFAARGGGQGGEGLRGGGQRGMGGGRIREAVLRELEPTLNDHQKQLAAQLRAGGGSRAEVRRRAVVYVMRDNKPEPLLVEVGMADNSHTLLFGGLNENDQVIVGGGPQAPVNLGQLAAGPGGPGAGPAGGGFGGPRRGP